MRLKLEELQKVVKKVVNDEKRVDALKEELTRCIGPTVVTTHGLKLMAETANNQLDVILHKGRQPKQPRTSVLLRFIDSDVPEVRRLVARLLPENFVRKMIGDSDFGVRLALAERLPADDVKKLLNRPGSDQIRVIYNRKRLQEAGLPNPKIDGEEFDINGGGPLGDTSLSDKHPGLTDQWYDTQARNLIKNFGGNLEGHWEENAVKTYCNGMKSQGIEIDHEKLLDAVFDHLANRDEKVVEEGSLKSIIKKLRLEEAMNTEVMPVISESIDPVAELNSSGRSPSEFASKFEEIYGVIKGPVANPGINLGINENFSRIIVPIDARVPGRSMSPADEKAIDSYVKIWNRQREIRKQPYRISWHPTQGNRVSFQLGVV